MRADMARHSLAMVIPMKYTRTLNSGFARYTSEDGRILIAEARWQVRFRRMVFGRRSARKNGWNVFVDGQRVAERVELLRDAKTDAEADLS